MAVTDVHDLDPSRVAVVLVDFQNDFCLGNAANAATARRAHELARQAAALGARVVHVRQVLDWDRLTPRQRRHEDLPGLCRAGTPGAELFLPPLPGAAVIDKDRFDLWRSEQWSAYLRANDDIEGLVIAGVELRCCVLHAVLGAEERGYAYVVPLDLVSGIEAGDDTYNEWVRRYLRDAHAAPESGHGLLAAWRARRR